jgi:tetratricopeptide (TPR) repeat protein
VRPSALPVALALSVALGACAGLRPRPPPERIEIAEPTVVEANREDLDLVGKNDEELFAVGSAAFAATDYRRAASAFARLADLFPESRHRPAALYDAGLAYERLDEWRLALERFRALSKEPSGADADEASFRAAECLYHLRELREAHAVLDRLAGRAELEPLDHIRALTQRGIVELEMGDPAAAERSLRLAVSAWGEARDKERLDDYYPGQAQFFLGEVYRGYFQALKFDPSRDSAEKLGDDLEQKAQLLLSAQGHYLRAVRIGNPDWTIAAGYRIGELYDELYTQMMEAPLPQGLSSEEQSAYREELQRRVSVLVQKAIAIYERTLATAQRAGVTNRFVEKTQASLDRMKKALLAAAGAAPADEKPVPGDADPEAPPPATP